MGWFRKACGEQTEKRIKADEGLMIKMDGLRLA
jgi:hypothetical protein